VLAVWEGLGYYSRARNLRRAAQAVVAEYGGVLPPHLESIAALPGVGRYTRCGDRQLCLRSSVPTVEANIARVLARMADTTTSDRLISRSRSAVV
jgi:A/G-specific adenine glycosylase